MQGIKSVRFEDVENIMDKMMKTQIFRNSEKREMLCTSSSSNDPNIIMDMRHKTIGEPLPVSMTKSAVLAEVTRMLMDEETQALYRKREQELLERELKKFQAGLSSSRPRFRGPYTCEKRKIYENIDDYDNLWKVAPRRIKVRVKDISRNIETRINRHNSYSVEPIKVTIKDKPIIVNKEQDQDILRACFQILTNHAKEERRLRELEKKIQNNTAIRRLRKYFDTWKTRMEDSKRLAMKRKNELEMWDERKIEMFVNAIKEKQKKMAKKPVIKESIARVDCRENEEKKMLDVKKKSTTRVKHVVVEPPAQNRLNAQKKIIAEQKMKLAEQNRIIEELRLKRIEDDVKKNGRDTISVAKDALAHCGQRTRRSLIQLMREEGCRDETLLQPPRIPSPPRFLARMEARAEARRERVRIAEEERKRKLEEQRMREEMARREDEENRKRLQLEAQREAKRIREEHERKRAREIERSKIANELADKFYRKYLLRRYIMDPLILIIELKHNLSKIATEHYERSLLRKSFKTWQTETRNQLGVKVELSIAIWRRNIMWYVFKNWRESARNESKKYQVAMDIYELRLQERCLKIWSNRMTERRLKNLENEQMAIFHAETRLKSSCFKNWRKFMKIADEVRESDRRRDMWRELVQRVVPDFDPKQRGVIIDD